MKISIFGLMLCLIWGQIAWASGEHFRNMPNDRLIYYAEQGNVEAQLHLADRYDEGFGIEQSFEQSAKWYRKAAEQNSAEAQFALSVMYDEGLGVPKDAKQAVFWLEKSAKLGNPVAQNSLGYRYYLGDNVSKDEAQSAKWFQLAAENGYAEALFRGQRRAERYLENVALLAPSR